jgi:hypothetical protein
MYTDLSRDDCNINLIETLNSPVDNIYNPYQSSAEVVDCLIIEIDTKFNYNGAAYKTHIHIQTIEYWYCHNLSVIVHQ